QSRNRVCTKARAADETDLLLKGQGPDKLLDAIVVSGHARRVNRKEAQKRREWSTHQGFCAAVGGALCSRRPLAAAARSSRAFQGSGPATGPLSVKSMIRSDFAS